MNVEKSNPELTNAVSPQIKHEVNDTRMIQRGFLAFCSDVSFHERVTEPVVTKLTEGGPLWSEDKLISLLDKRLRIYSRNHKGKTPYENVHAEFGEFMVAAVVAGRESSEQVSLFWSTRVSEVGKAKTRNSAKRMTSQALRPEAAPQSKNEWSGKPTRAALIAKRKLKAEAARQTEVPKTQTGNLFHKNKLAKGAKTSKNVRLLKKQAKRSTSKALTGPKAVFKRTTRPFHSKKSVSRSSSPNARNGDRGLSPRGYKTDW